jgi:hypothetical protein
MLIVHLWACSRFHTRQGLAEVILKAMPKEVTGNEFKLRSLNRISFSEIAIMESIEWTRRRNAEKYVIAWLIFSMLLIASGIQNLGGHAQITGIDRPDFGQENKKITLLIKAKSGQTAITEQSELIIKARQINASQKQVLLSEKASMLPSIIVGENTSLNEVQTNLNLITEDRRTGIKIDWHSSNPEIIREDGFVDPLGLIGSTVIKLSAELSLDEIKEMRTFYIGVTPSVSQDHIRALLHTKLADLLEGLSTSGENNYVDLPSNYGKAMTLSWYAFKKDNTVLLMVLFIFSLLAIYYKRYSTMERRVMVRQAAIIREFPYFISKFILLLNAGLVVSSAMNKITEDYLRYGNVDEKKPLYEDLCMIRDRMRSTNGVLAYELRKYAELSGIREMLRFAAIVNDNIDKGSTLAEKLEAESSLLWYNRKKKAEELGRLADTKLVLPLLILLLLLIMITIAPALMAM